MKTIALLTDFSERSTHAAKFALLIAQKIRANVLLYNSFRIPELVGIGRHRGNHGYSEFKNKSQSNLRALSQELRDYFKETVHYPSFTPMIDFQCEEGVVANAVAELEENKDIVLLVIGTHGTDNKQAFLMGNNCLQIIDAANTPLLIVPENTLLKPIEKFVLATDASMSDIDYIIALSGLAKYFLAEVLVINIVDHSNTNEHRELNEHKFKKAILKNVVNNNVQYNSVTDYDIKEGFDWIMENIIFNIMVMIHRKSSQYDYFLKSSLTKNMANSTDIPLLVFPHPVVKLPQF